MRLLTNNPRKFVGLEGYGLSVAETLPLEIPPSSEFTARYLKTKKDKLGPQAERRFDAVARIGLSRDRATITGSALEAVSWSLARSLRMTFASQRMFESLSNRLQDVFRSLRGEARLTEATVEAALREIRLALLEADVNFQRRQGVHRSRARPRRSATRCCRA